MNGEPSSDPSLTAFFIGGVQKGGTTALAKMLAQHPSLQHPIEGKEVHWFDNDAAFASGSPDPAAYHAYWRTLERPLMRFEATPIYMYWSNVAERVRAYNPAMKWILLLRDPVMRAYSHWNMLRERGQEPLGFVDALEAEPARTRNGGALAAKYGYLSRGRYVAQIDRLLLHFPPGQLLALKSEDLYEHPGRLLPRILDFVGVPAATLQGLRARVGTYDASLDPALRSRLFALFEDDVVELERRFGWNLASWRP